MQEKILDFLKKKPEYVSGDHISTRLGITRQALWKHIQELKDTGYVIAAVPHLGYRLESCPDRLYPYEISQDLGTKFIGKKIYYFDSLSSTMDRAMELGLQGAPNGTAVVTETQRQGRGRLGRSWFSPKYKGIYLSLILRPPVLPQEASLLTLFSAVSVCEAIRAQAAIDVRIKWPNDIVMHRKKLGGILLELNAETDRIHFVIIGIGLNVNNDRQSLVAGASSIFEQKKETISRVELLREILRRIEENYLSLDRGASRLILEKWRELNVTLGQRVKVLYQKQRVEGVAVDIDSDGGLLIRKDSGISFKVNAGDIFY